MATGKVYYWLRLKKNFMTSDTVDFLMSQPEGANYVVLYQMLHLMSINTEGRLSRTIGDVIIPYDVKKIQRDTKWFTADTINVALSLFMKLGLVYRDVDGVLVMADHKNLIGSETDYAEQKRVQRNEKAVAKAIPQECGQCPQPVHSTVHTEIRDKSIEIRDKKDLSISDEIDCCTDVQRVVNAWNAIDGLSKIIKLEPESKRGQMLGARIKQYGIEQVIRAIESVPNSSFLMGKTKKQFKLTFDWLVKPNNFPKVLEGNYLDENKTVYAPDSEPYRGAKYLAKLLRKRLPTLPEYSEDTLQKWAAALDELHGEGHEWDEISDVMNLSQNSDFWQRQICDAYALKRKYVNLLADLQRG